MGIFDSKEEKEAKAIEEAHNRGQELGSTDAAPWVVGASRMWRSEAETEAFDAGYENGLKNQGK